MQLIDTHVHLNFDTFREDLDALQTRWQEAGVIQLIHSCVEPGEFPATRSLADRLGNLSFSVGLHPLDAHKWHANSQVEIRTLAISDPRVVAIGELGLDFYKAENQQQQKSVCQAQLELAVALDLPVIVHCRDAAASLRELMEKINRDKNPARKPIRGVMHCWSGTPEETQWFLDLGFYISFSGIVTFKKAETVKQSARIVPSDRLLIETDCPFLAPIPKRGKRNEPAFVRYVAEELAKLRQCDLETLARQTTENACDLFNLTI
ncbi:MAG: TatD family hydrolase [Cyanobacteria bacterium SBLK]|nr:TatD family hydrolase [Cyanobacteria bacterium SBLK]